MVFFLIGYMVSIGLVLAGQFDLLLTLTGLVFFMGALFVFFVLNTAKSDIENIDASHKELLKANYELKKTNRELDLFTYSISHDLRSPIASIRGLVDVAKLNASKEEVEFCLQNIASNTVRLDNFINDVLSITQNARSELNKEQFDFHRLVQDEIIGLQHIEIGKAIDFDNQVPEETMVLSDPLRLKIILHNLLANAVKYHDPKKENKFVRVSCTHEDGNGFKFSIADNGSGISENARDKVFQMFYRATDTSIGTGLGLYIVKEVVEKLNGEIKLTSDLDIGTEFTVTLPR